MCPRTGWISTDRALVRSPVGGRGHSLWQSTHQGGVCDPYGVPGIWEGFLEEGAALEPWTWG